MEQSSASPSRQSLPTHYSTDTETNSSDIHSTTSSAPSPDLISRIKVVVDRQKTDVSLAECSPTKQAQYLAKTAQKFGNLKSQLKMFCDPRTSLSDKNTLRTTMKVSITSINKELVPLSIVYPNITQSIDWEIQLIQNTLLLIESSPAEQERRLAKTAAKFNALTRQLTVCCDPKTILSDKDTLKVTMRANIASIEEELLPLSAIYPTVTTTIALELKLIQKALHLLDSSSA